MSAVESTSHDLDERLSWEVMVDACTAADGLEALLPAIFYATARASDAMTRVAKGHEGHGLTDAEFVPALDQSVWRKLADHLYLVEAMTRHAIEGRPLGEDAERIDQFIAEYRVAIG